MKTKPPSDFHEALMRAWSMGWITGCDGITGDDSKRADARTVAKSFPLLSAAPDLLEIAIHVVEIIKAFEKQQPISPDSLLFKLATKARAAIARATPEAPHA